jgi:hypothetical protein
MTARSAGGPCLSSTSSTGALLCRYRDTMIQLMASETIISISHEELLEAVWKTITEFLQTTGDPMFRSASAAAASSAGASEAAELFWRHVHARSRSLSEAAERSERDRTLVVIVDEGVGMTAVELLEHLGGFAHERERFIGLVEALMPSEPIPPTAVVEQARSNAAARAAFLTEFGALSSSDVADLYGSEAQNRAALAQGWRKQQRIFAVPTSSGLRFPLFQFQPDGQPKPQIAPVLRHLKKVGLHGWEIGLWFTSSLASLEGARPVDVLDEDPPRVEAAAAQLNAIPY